MQQKTNAYHKNKLLGQILHRQQELENEQYMLDLMVFALSLLVQIICAFLVKALGCDRQSDIFGLCKI